ncbi:flagellar biosynthesis anti-sigma factor FlgM [Bacillus sp. FJAT-29790]|uniref:flagellar biosynthesis anti-sigma factor FlgM n=1 Tax=Bacillus sp. FJAT-29790 TaxID=1895002 RepID=UPI001C210F85|nr:flagellar biosynthesis anti-sigma factor FlgM [Bacillus sp. FJAT-29790]
MKINNIGRVGMNPYNKQLEKMEKVANTSKKDKIEISTEALELQKGNPIEAQRQKIVEELKDKVKSGEYEIEPAKVAEKMYSFWNDKF